MQVLFKSRDPQAHELRDLVQRRMRFVFRRIDWLIPKATVQLSDVNGPRHIVVASAARDWRTALDKALARAARFVMRQWPRGADNRRPRQRAILLSNGEE